MRRFAVLLAVLALLASASGVAAAGGKPSNDLPKGAIAVPDTLPQTITQDTTKATVSSKDDFGCGAGGTDQATVWYTFTPTSEKEVFIDASASSYLVGVNVFVGSADPANLIWCAENFADFFASAGTTYYVMFADIDGDTTNGGTLNATFELPPPPVVVHLTVNPTATISRSGVVTVTGSLTCDQETLFAEVDLFLSQTVGRFVIQGFGYTAATCGTAATSWSADVIGSNGRFGGGSIDAQVSAFACNNFTCGGDFVQTTLKARR